VPGESSALRIVGFLVVAHVAFDAHLALTVLLCNRVSSCPAIESRPVGEHGENLPRALCLYLAAASSSCIVLTSSAYGSSSRTVTRVPRHQHLFPNYLMRLLRGGETVKKCAAIV
jgi:hypothetical protein